MGHQLLLMLGTSVWMNGTAPSGSERPLALTLAVTVPKPNGEPMASIRPRKSATLPNCTTGIFGVDAQHRHVGWGLRPALWRGTRGGRSASP
jgi:hypothetical protein